MPDDMLRVGVITAPHGVRGEVKVYSTTDDPRRFKKLGSVIVLTEKEEKYLTISSAKISGRMPVLRFKEINTAEEVGRLRGAEIYVRREDAVQLQTDEYFIGDLLGLKVFSTEGEELGILKDVIRTGSNDVYEISKDGEVPLLLPAIRECIRRIDVAEGRMVVYLMPGLRG